MAVFDPLSKDKDAITQHDLSKIKKMARELMDSLIEQQQILGNLRDRASSQAQMKVAIIDQLLVRMPDDYSNDDIEARADVVFSMFSGKCSIRRCIDHSKAGFFLRLL
ncbi:hypothetical protein NP590_06520 [Methylomonas sp. SURF-2]|uniref:Uncharacterized protein n=1 Tax=Methylomonas subterranea TaxID=2952225 RepID=A0ABT1TE68_9GAMM|nr:hypothetical protein [Methylomonas sp. SURF-2]MCQ8103753.1 hypothetical protein [Methylomonas sp. SURF-2]